MLRRPRMFLAALLLGAARAESEALWYWPALDTPDLPETTQHLDALRKPVPENQTMVSVFSGHDAHLGREAFHTKPPPDVEVRLPTLVDRVGPPVESTPFGRRHVPRTSEDDAHLRGRSTRSDVASR